MKWSLYFSTVGGYDCMTGAWVISSSDNKRYITVDLADYGSPTCGDARQESFRSAEAERDARTICDALNARDTV
jgi:hypothetical protein